MPEMIKALRLTLLVLCCLVGAGAARAQTLQPIVSPVCNQPMQQAFNQGRELAVWNELARDDATYNYKVSAAYAANCINQFKDYIDKISKAITAVTTAASATSVAAAAVTLIATQIMDAVLTQVINAINNQICQVTNEVMGALDSAVQNAICLPTIGGGLGRIGFNVDIDLGRTQCNGWSINPVGVFSAQGIDLNAPSGSAFDAPVVIGQPVTGIGSVYSVNRIFAGGGLSYASDLPPSFRMDLPDSAVGAYDYIEGSDVPTNVNNGPIGTVITPFGSCAEDTGAKGGYAEFLAALGRRESQTCSKPGGLMQYGCMNGPGFAGKYQMGEPILYDLCHPDRGACYVTGCGSSCSNSWNDVKWSGKDGVNSLQDFLNSPAAQEKAVLAEMNLLWSRIVRLGLDKYIGQTVNGVTLTKSGLLAASHLIGVGGMYKGQPVGLYRAIKYGSNVSDGNGTSWLEYAGLLGGYETPQSCSN